MKKNLAFLLNIMLFSFIATAQYKVSYRIESKFDLLTMKTFAELGTLYINDNHTSTFFSVNYFKTDSLRRLVGEGKIPPSTVKKVPYPNTVLSHLIEKQYSNQNIKVFNKIIRYNYVYSIKNNLDWELHPADTMRIKNYICYKATTKFEGREYVAWYTPEIPISDGPYKFWGLPGLILKVSDTENHYIFTLESFEKYFDELPILTFKETKTFELTYEKFQIFHKDFIANPMQILEGQGAKVVSINGQDPASIPTRKKKNPIERY